MDDAARDFACHFRSLLDEEAEKKDWLAQHAHEAPNASDAVENIPTHVLVKQQEYLKVQADAATLAKSLHSLRVLLANRGNELPERIKDHLERIEADKVLVSWVTIIC